MKEIECSGRKLRGDLLGGWADKEVFSEADTFMNSEGLEGASGAKGWGEWGGIASRWRRQHECRPWSKRVRRGRGSSKVGRRPGEPFLGSVSWESPKVRDKHCFPSKDYRMLKWAPRKTRVLY